MLHVCTLFVICSAMPCALCLLIMGCVVCDACLCDVLLVFTCCDCNVVRDDGMIVLLLFFVMCVRECVLSNVRVCVLFVI